MFLKKFGYLSSHISSCDFRALPRVRCRSAAIQRLSLGFPTLQQRVVPTAQLRRNGKFVMISGSCLSCGR